MKLTGYDADEGRRYYVDTKDGSTWVGAPYAEYGTLTRLRSGTTVREDNERYRRKAYNSLSESSEKGKPPRRRSTRDGQTLDGADKPLPTAPASPVPDGRDPEKSQVEDGKDASSRSTRVASPKPIAPSESSGSVYSQSSYPHDGQTTRTATTRRKAQVPRTTSPTPITSTESSASMYSQSSYPRDGNATPTAAERSQTLDLWIAWDMRARAGSGSGSRDQEERVDTRTTSAPNLADSGVQDGKDLPSSDNDSKQDLADTVSSVAIEPLLSQNEAAHTSRKRKHPALRQISRLIARVL
ncbi:hypothetical protein NLJ89_g2030 [Agrocybe chaxingu]|uniref:Uncharacterized protein n=1 Tax=Agrocybe chaxingu TaxID=84603 RepID=A0A9W8MYC0_9AGAR|nr:hypothetical protein NLJ89_g2030 [Agrocybe chaxingu]